MNALSEWMNRNPRRAAAGAAAALLLAAVLMYLFVFSPGGGQNDQVVQKLPASGAMASVAMTPNTALISSGSPGAVDLDAIPAERKRHQPEPEPMSPWWSSRPVITIDPIHPGPRAKPHTTPSEPLPPDAIFVPPTPPVSVHGAAFVASRQEPIASRPGVTVPPTMDPPRIEDFSRDPAPASEDPDDRVSGVVADGDHVVAVLEQSGAGGRTDTYVVQPGDRAGEDTVVAITPDGVVLDRDGRRRTLTILPGLPDGSG